MKHVSRFLLFQEWNTVDLPSADVNEAPLSALWAVRMLENFKGRRRYSCLPSFTKNVTRVGKFPWLVPTLRRHAFPSLRCPAGGSSCVRRFMQLRAASSVQDCEDLWTNRKQYLRILYNIRNSQYLKKIAVITKISR
jgi:hypothetical protein